MTNDEKGKGAREQGGRGAEDQGERMEGGRVRISQADLHSHLRARMRQRGVIREEIERTLNEGWEALDAKPGTLGRVMVFPYEAEWEGQFYQEKEVTAYYKVTDEGLILLTVKARYGQGFPRG